VRNITSLRFILALCVVTLAAPAVNADETGGPPQLLRHAFQLADLNNWTDAEPDFVAAAATFRRNGDRRGLAYAELGIIRATIQRRNLSLTSNGLQHRLESDPLMKADRELRLFCLSIKGEIDGEMEAAAMRKDWEEVARLAMESSDPRWKYRASAELGLAAFYQGDLETARKNIGGALVAATQAQDVGGQIKYLYAIGTGLNMSRMNAEAVPYLDKAIALSQATPGAPYPFLIYLAKAESLAALGQNQESRKVITGLLESARQRKTAFYEALILATVAQIEAAQGNADGAVQDLQRAIRLCEAGGYTRALTESRLALANVYSAKGDLRQAEALLVSATATTQRNGELYILPKRLEILAEIQAREGKFAEADATYDRAAAFVDASIGRDSAVLDKTAWIKSVSDMYVAHFALIAEHLNNPAKAYEVVEQVRGRILTDLLLGGSEAPARAQQNESQISRLRIGMMAARSTGEIQKLRDQMFLLEQARWVTPEVNILKAKSYSHVPLRDIQRTMSTDATILEYVLAEPASWVLIIRRNSVNIVRLTGKGHVDTLVSAYLQAVKQKQPADAAAGELYSALLGPVNDWYPKGDLMIVRDGLLNMLPFDSLREPSGKYVGERSVISYLPSAGGFYLLARQSQRPDMATKVFAMGAVPYEHERNYFRNLIETRGFGPAVAGNLQNSREEAMTAMAGASEGDKQLILGSAATETAFKKAATEKYRIVHLAVHSAVDPGRPDRAALVVLGDAAAGEDGLLQASEIAQLRLKANLVVLSACDTAVGPVQGQEGVATLARSFLLAGAQNVISTLWSTDDNASLAVVRQFYAHLAAGESAASSLAAAKRDFLAKFGAKSVPYYWAAFTFEGVPRTATIFHEQKRITNYTAQSRGASGNRKSD